MPMELRKRKAPAPPAAPPPAPKRKAAPKKAVPKTDDKPATAKTEDKPVESKSPEQPKTVTKKVSLPKKDATKGGEKVEVTTQPVDPEVLPEAPSTSEAPAAEVKGKDTKATAKGRKPKETKEVAQKAEAAAVPEPAKETVTKGEASVEKPANKEKKAAVAPKEKKPAATAKAKKEKEEATTTKPETKPAEEKVTEKEVAAPAPKETKEKKAPAPKVSASKASASSASSSDLKEGDSLPSDLPEISNQSGEKITINSLLDACKTGIVIFAYPKESTPGCTKQANLFNVSKDSFEQEGYSIYGLSGDKPERNSKFKEKQGLNYSLLSDVSYDLHKKFGIGKPGGGPGTTRSVVIISKDGKIVGLKKAGPEDTVKFARTSCGLPAEDSKLKQAEKVQNEKETKEKQEEKVETTSGEVAVSKQPTVEEASES